jgi:hypothetical protein
VEHWDGLESKIKFHGRPDGGATCPDARGESSSSTSNSTSDVNPGLDMCQQFRNGNKWSRGVGALTFDVEGNLLHCQMVWHFEYF